MSSKWFLERTGNGWDVESTYGAEPGRYNIRLTVYDGGRRAGRVVVKGVGIEVIHEIGNYGRYTDKRLIDMFRSQAILDGKDVSWMKGVE